MPIKLPTPPSPPHFYPQNDYDIIRYWKLEKFLSLLQRKQLFFCRLDYLSDKFEGTTAKPNYNDRILAWKQQRDSGFFNIEISDELIIERVNGQYALEKKLKALTLVNCWNKYEGESAALWMIYAGLNNGLATKSTIYGIHNALVNTKEEFYLSEIRYMNYDNEIMPDGNTMYPVIHKHNAYGYEDEVRLIHNLLPQNGWEYEWDKEYSKAGMYFDVDIEKLIDEIIISPNADKWFFDLVNNIIGKYGLKKDVKYSTLK